MTELHNELDQRKCKRRNSSDDQGHVRRQSQLTCPDLLFSNELNVKSPPTIWMRAYRHRGILYVILAALFSASHSMLVKYVKDDVHPMEISFVRFFLQLAIPVPIITYRAISPKPESPKILLLLVSRSLIGMLALISLFYSFYFMPVGDASAIVFGSPVLVGIFGRIFLKDPFGIADILLVCVVISGVFLISQPPFLFGGGDDGGDSSQFIGAMIALAACTMISITTIIMSKLGQLHVNSFKIVLFYATIASLGTALLATAVEAWSIPPCGWVRIALVVMGILNCAAQILVTYSLSLERSIFVSILRSNEVLFSYMLEFFIFGVSPNIWAFLGATLVLFGSIAASLKKMFISKKKGIAKARRLLLMSSHIAEEVTEKDNEITAI